MSISIDLSGHRALVTGASRGIGRAISLALGNAGAEVVLCSRNADALAEVSSDLVAVGARAHVFPADLSDTQGISSYFDGVVSACGTVDILVNNAGVNLRSPAADMDLDTWQKVLDLNLTAVFAMSQAFFRHLNTTGGGGSIVNIASLLSEAARPTIAPYTASKGGIRQLTKALAVEWAQHGIRVNAVGPGYIETEMTQVLVDNSEFDVWVKSRTPMGRWGKPDEIASAVLFLVSDLARFITGHVLYVDGGWLAAL